MLKRAASVAITDKAGLAGIKHWIEATYQVEIAKHDPRVIKIKDKIDAEYSDNRVSAISDEEMFEWVKEVFGKELPPLR